MEYGCGRFGPFYCWGLSTMSMPDPISRSLCDLKEARTSPALPGDLVRALGWLHGHLCEPIQLEHLAQIGGVRPRTLEMHFKIFLGTTPLGWVRRMRLARARLELLNASPRATVTGIALSSGFSELGRFAGQYRKAFGELPSMTMQRTRSSASFDIGHPATRLRSRT